VGLGLLLLTLSSLQRECGCCQWQQRRAPVLLAKQLRESASSYDDVMLVDWGHPTQQVLCKAEGITCKGKAGSLSWARGMASAAAGMVTPCVQFGRKSVYAIHSPASSVESSMTDSVLLL
jgi:hypothetical protein